MADNFLNKTGLTYFYNRLKTVFASQSDLDDVETQVQALITEGGEPNTIETVKVNGTALTPDAQKAVDVTVPTALSQLTNDGDGTTGSAYATEDYVDTNGGKIDKIKVYGIEQTITDKAVDLSIPRIGSHLGTDLDVRGLDISQGTYDNIVTLSMVSSNNGSAGTIHLPNISYLDNQGYQTARDVQNAINTAVASAYRYKGSVADMAALEAVLEIETGDVYDVQSTGMNYAWTGTAWDALGSYVDTSVLWTNTTGQNNTLLAITTAEIDTIMDGE